MIDRKLRQLSEYIDELYHLDSYDRFIRQIKFLENRGQSDRSEPLRREKDIFEDLDNMFRKYSEEMVSSEQFLYVLYEYLEENLMRHLIFQKARDLGIDPMLFKREMGFLFKGKPLE